jgi:uncharacterized protein YacL
MGSAREDRLPLRLTEKVSLVAAFAAGAALSPGTIDSEVGKTLATFLGLISASVLPTISLLINSMASGGRSVQAVNDLNRELEAAIDALLLLFGCVGLVVGALISLSVSPPDALTKVPYLTTNILPRMGQAWVIGPVVLALLRVGQIPAILRRSLAARHVIAVEEARRKTLEQAGKVGAASDYFPTHPDYGKSVALSELQGSEKH